MNKTSLPVIVLRNIILFPKSEIRLEIDSAKERELISLALSYYDKHILVVHQEDALESSINMNLLPRVGVVGYIEMKIDMPNQVTRVVIKGLNRVICDEYEEDDEKFLKTYVTPISLEKLSNEEEIAYSRSLVKQLEYYIDKNPNMSNSILSQIENLFDLNKLTDIVSDFLPVSYERKLAYLEELDPTNRVMMLIEDINQELKIINLEKEIEDKVGKNLDKAQKDYYLQEKLRVIKDELDISYDKDKEIDDLKIKIDNLNCNSKVRKRLYEELRRYEITPVTSPEILLIRTYIDWMLSLPWNNITKTSPNLRAVLNNFNKTHYGLDDVKTRIIEYLALESYKKGNSPIICLVGPPGVGKTSFAKSIATSIGRNFVKISVGGINDEAEIIGHRRAYVGSSPGRIVQGLKKAKTSNPVFVIDEIDKMCKDIKGNPTSALLEVLDKEQNNAFYDNYIEEEIDLSEVFFITTANYEEQIPFELLDRLEIIKIDGYTEYDKQKIAEKYVIPKSMEKHGLSKSRVSFSKEAILKIIRNYTKEAGIRDLERKIDSILRKIVMDIVTNSTKNKYLITEDSIIKYLGNDIYIDNIFDYKSRIGVSNALCYTAYGGDILPIEVSIYNGDGKIITTGSLGEVFNESVKIALSYIKTNNKKLKINNDTIKNVDIHLHAPFTSVKKEGPSAGIAITTAIISFLKNKEISKTVALTGEISLHGNILPVGGIKEKIIGARKGDIKKIILPMANKYDVLKLDEEIKKDIEFIYVSKYDEVIKELKI